MWVVLGSGRGTNKVWTQKQSEERGAEAVIAGSPMELGPHGKGAAGRNLHRGYLSL